MYYSQIFPAMFKLREICNLIQGKGVFHFFSLVTDFPDNTSQRERRQRSRLESHDIDLSQTRVTDLMTLDST